MLESIENVIQKWQTKESWDFTIAESRDEVSKFRTYEDKDPFPRTFTEPITKV